jgi:hypothetical protein
MSIKREFHASAKREVLPLIALAVVGVIGRYSVKAIARMNREQEEYDAMIASGDFRG